MGELAVVLVIAIVGVPFLLYWNSSRRAHDDLAQVLQKGFVPTTVCEFLSFGYKIAFDSAHQKIALVNVDFQTYSNDMFDGREFSKHRLTDVLDYSMIERISINRSKINGELSTSGLITIRLAANERENTRTEVTMAFTHHDTKAVVALEEAWPALVKINP